MGYNYCVRASVFFRNHGSKLITVVIFAVFAFISNAFAWTSAPLNPPSGNVSAPLNESNAAQSKIGGLLLNTGGAVNGLIVPFGKVGIGTTSPDQQLSVAGVIESTIGGFKFPDGTTQSSAVATSSGSGVPNTSVFNSSGSFTIPAGVTRVIVEVWGGGGNGGRADPVAGNSNSGGGGGGGGYGRQAFTVTPGTVYTVTVGGPGGASSFGSLISATGGQNGGNATYPSGGGIGGLGGTSSGSVNITGGTGSGGSYFMVSGGFKYPAGGAGGSAGNGGIGGGGGPGNQNGAYLDGASGYPGTVPGGGGGGGGGGGTNFAPGGAGAPGRILVTY